MHKSTGLEITTWIGDLGGGAGMLAHRRVLNPEKRAIDMFNNSPHDFGGWLNIEGDMAAYLIGRDTTSIDGTPELNYNENQYIADILESYLLPQPSLPGSEWNRRGLIFLQMLGGEIENGKLQNEESLAQKLSKEVEDFAENYLINLALSQDVNLLEASRYLNGAAKEITLLFINALKNVAANPNKAAQPSNFDPSPTPAGKPYSKFRVMNKTNELIKKIENWINNN